MEPEEIKKALEICSKGIMFSKHDCKKCPYYAELCCERKLKENTLDLINQYEAEIKRLEDAKNAYKDIVDTCEIGAIKEFAERLKERYWQEDGCWLNIDICEDIDNLLKEMGVE